MSCDVVGRTARLTSNSCRSQQWECGKNQWEPIRATEWSAVDKLLLLLVLLTFGFVCRTSTMDKLRPPSVHPGTEPRT